MGSKHLADASSRGEEPDLDAVEGILLQHLYRVGFAPELQLLADGSLRGQQPQFAHGEVPLLENADHFVSDGARGADDGYPVGSHGFPSLLERLVPCIRYPPANGGMPLTARS